MAAIGPGWCAEFGLIAIDQGSIAADPFGEAFLSRKFDKSMTETEVQIFVSEFAVENMLSTVFWVGGFRKMVFSISLRS